MAARERVTINDVAVAAGLSKGTVSRALNGYSDISRSTRVRVKRLARRMGYQPLAQAQALKTGRVRALGLVLNTGNADLHRPFLTDFLDGISRAASQEDWTLTVATATGTDDEVATMARLIDERKVDGFILPRAMWEDPRVDLCRDRGVPFVLYGRNSDPRDCSWFDIAGEAAIEAAVARLAALGHRGIGFINGSRIYTYAHLRADGFAQAMDKAGLRVEPTWILEGALDVAAGERLGLRILSQNPSPTAIVCALDIAAIGLYRAAAQLGRRIGHDLSVISYDGLPETAQLDPPLTTFAVDTRSAGERLAQSLIARVRGAAVEELRDVVPAQLIARGSDRPPPTH